jgi:hypothetical protein
MRAKSAPKQNKKRTLLIGANGTKRFEAKIGKRNEEQEEEEEDSDREVHRQARTVEDEIGHRNRVQQ